MYKVRFNYLKSRYKSYVTTFFTTEKSHNQQQKKSTFDKTFLLNQFINRKVLSREIKDTYSKIIGRYIYES